MLYFILVFLFLEEFTQASRKLFEININLCVETKGSFQEITKSPELKKTTQLYNDSVFLLCLKLSKTKTNSEFFEIYTRNKEEQNNSDQQKTSDVFPIFNQENLKKIIVDKKNKKLWVKKDKLLYEFVLVEYKNTGLSELMWYLKTYFNQIIINRLLFEMPVSKQESKDTFNLRFFKSYNKKKCWIVEYQNGFKSEKRIHCNNLKTIKVDEILNKISFSVETTERKTIEYKYVPDNKLNLLNFILNLSKDYIELDLTIITKVLIEETEQPRKEYFLQFLLDNKNGLNSIQYFNTKGTHLIWHIIKLAILFFFQIQVSWRYEP